MENVFYGKIISNVSSMATSRFSKFVNLVLKKQLTEKEEEICNQIQNGYTEIKHFEAKGESFTDYINGINAIQKRINESLKELSLHDKEGYFSDFIKTHSDEDLKEYYSSQMALFDEYHDILNKDFTFKDVVSMSIEANATKKDVVSAYNMARRDKEKTIEYLAKTLTTKTVYKLSNMASFIRDIDLERSYPRLEERLYNVYYTRLKEDKDQLTFIKDAVSELQ